MINLAKLKEEQLKLAKKVTLTDDFDKLQTIAGADQTYYENKIISLIAVFNLKTLEFIESKYTVSEVKGILHPRKIGLASHIGLALDIPTIGVAKRLLCGELKDDTIYLEQDVIGKCIATKDVAKPIYVSQGHKIGIKTMMEITKHLLKGHKLPEPLYAAHKLATRFKKRFKDEKSEP